SPLSRRECEAQRRSRRGVRCYRTWPYTEVRPHRLMRLALTSRDRGHRHYLMTQSRHEVDGPRRVHRQMPPIADRPLAFAMLSHAPPPSPPPSRRERLDALRDEEFDLLVIGGGLTRCRHAPHPPLPRP